MMRCPKCHFEWVSTQRSNKQNRYFHGVVLPMIAEEMGEWDSEHVKDYLKEKFLFNYEVVTTKHGVKFEAKKLGHTSDLDTKEMESFIEKIRFWARDFLKLDIPEPNEEAK